MANAVTVQIMEDGPRNVVAKVSVVLDTADLTETVILDPATLFKDQTGLPTTMLAIRSLKFAVPNPIQLRLQWKGATNAEAYSMYDTQDLFFDFGGYIHNNALTPNGQIVMISNGWIAGTYAASFVIACVKTNG